MPTVKLVVEYDGALFHGWQAQEGVRTVQQELHRVVALVTREEIRVLHAAGRTDAGVHARGQVVSFLLRQQVDLGRLMRSINGLLKGEIVVLHATIVPDTFHPRRSSTRKHYCYRILRRVAPPVLEKGRVWHVSFPLDLPRMREAAGELVGTHDFTSMRARGCQAVSPVKTIYESRIAEEGDLLSYHVIGSGFLQHMVRIIAGTLVDIGRGRITLSMEELLDAKDRQTTGVTAPPYGLTLESVEYPVGFCEEACTV